MHPAHTCLVTGGAGYVGAVVVDHLLRAGHGVRVLDRVAAPVWAAQAPDVYLHGDIRDTRLVATACAGADIVVHCVAHVPLHRDLAEMYSVNVEGTRVLLAAAQAANVAKVVAVSSSAVLGIPDRPIVTEDAPVRPMDPYGEAKAHAEALCREHAARGLDVTVVRPRTVVGPGRLGIFQILFEWLAQGRDLPVLGGGRNVYQFVHGADLADAISRAARRPGPETYHVGAPEPTTMTEALTALAQHAGTGSRVVSLPRRPAEWAMRATSRLGLSPLGAYHALMYGRSLAFDTAKARRELGWTPACDNHALLADAYDAYLRDRAVVLASGGGSVHRSPVRQGVLAWLPRVLAVLPAVRP
ncbi:MAG: NAD-dependent epimerase/dehydratase family protein [Deltaproteobacteria bacterium]|nr:NAD-dependent epimerase/dehydratase family protein [Deltaproteobacteria bacterium]